MVAKGGVEGRDGVEGEGWGGGERDGLESGVGRCKLLHLEWINNKVLMAAQGTIFSIL